MQPRHPVGRRGTFEKDPGLGTLALLNRALEDAMSRPAGQFGLLKGYKIGVGGHRCEHRVSIVEVTGARPRGTARH